MILRQPHRRNPSLFLFFATTTATIAVASIAILTRTPILASAFRSLPPRTHRGIAGSSSSSNSASFSSSTQTDNAMSSSASASTLPSDGEVTVPHLSPSTLRSLVSYAVSYGAAHGLQVSVKHPSSSSSSSHVIAPISLLPQAYPSPLFHRAISLARPFNLLVDRIGRDGEFLKTTLRGAREVDPFTGKLSELYERIYSGGAEEERGKFAKTADRLGIHRSDYMLHRPPSSSSSSGGYELKQVELNTIASSFAGLAERVADLHGFLTERLRDEGTLDAFLEENESAVSGSSPREDDREDDGDRRKRGVPRSPATTRLPSAMALAHERYRRRYLSSSSDERPASVRPVVLFVVQPGETNTVDQRLLEFRLWEDHGIGVVRLSLAEVYRRVRLDETDGRLLLGDDGEDDNENENDEMENMETTSERNVIQREITVVYFRAGYAPTDYPSGYDTSPDDDATGIEWLARERLERSRAAKCPSLGYHLAGCKKVQQELARPGVLERFFPNDDREETPVVPLLRSAFAGLYALGADADEGDLDAVRDVLFREGERRYVLKPQREGGGYNFYGKELANKLRQHCTVVDEDGDGKQNIVLGNALSEFILMERLFPPQQRAILLRNGIVEGSGMTISELGCFGTIVASAEGEVVHNEYAGFLLRTKFSGVDEGGVASGFATLSSPYLC